MTIHDDDTSGNFWLPPQGCIVGELIGVVLPGVYRRQSPALMPR